MTTLESAKKVVLSFQRRLDDATPGETTKVFTETHTSNHAYRGVRPFYHLAGPTAAAETVWAPLKRAMSCLQRRHDMFLASRNNLDESSPVWVVSMGNFLGDFADAWNGLPSTGKTTYLPYVTFNRVENGQIAETVEFLDILAVLTQAGLNPLSRHQTGGHIMSPGPKTHDGILYRAQPEDATRQTFELASAMLIDLAKSYTSPEDHLARFWHRDMNWFGPTGIGASLGFPGYRRGHTGAFEDKQEVVQAHDWEVAAAEGEFAAFMWWPGLTMKNTGGYLGAPANETEAEMRIVDLYRRDGTLLAENWIFIDILHFLAEQGLDLLADAGETA